MDDLISRQAVINTIHNYWKKRLDTLPTRMTEGGEVYADIKSMDMILEHNNILSNMIKQLPSAQLEIIRCKDCNKASKCYGDVVMRSRGGGYIYCPLEFCSEAERRTDE